MLCVWLLKEVYVVNKHCLHFIVEFNDVRGEYTQIPGADGLMAWWASSCPLAVTADGGTTQGHGLVGLAGTGATDEDQIAGLVEEGAP